MADFDNNRFKSKGQEWETPQALFDRLDNEFNFELDIAADEHNAKCSKYFTIDDDAMTKDWFGVCWLNPPYGSKGKMLKDWVRKAYEEGQRGKGFIVMLIPARTNTLWWHEYCMNADEVRFIKGRPKFKGCTHGLPQPLAIIVFSQNNHTKFSTFDINDAPLIESIEGT